MESNESNASMTNKSYFMWAFVPFLIITIIYFKWQYAGKMSYQPSVLDLNEKTNYTFQFNFKKMGLKQKLVCVLILANGKGKKSYYILETDLAKISA